MQLKWHIPEPCQEDWNQMVPEGHGRYCSSCSKTVIDFTGWEPAEIAGYLETRTSQQICGRFRVGQLESGMPVDVDDWTRRIVASDLSFIRQIAAVMVVIFGIGLSSCNDVQVAGGIHRRPDSLAHSQADSLRAVDTSARVPGKSDITGTDSSASRPVTDNGDENFIVGEIIPEYIRDSSLKEPLVLPVE